MDEARTRREVIDSRLGLAGWDVDDPAKVTQELDIDFSKPGTLKVKDPGKPYKGHQFADYGLVHQGTALAVVEAKKTSRDARVGQEQALQYAKNLQKIHGGDLPFVLYTNGHDIYFWESEFYPPIRVHGFPTRDDLEWLGQRRKSRQPLSVELIDKNISGRDYQIAAIRTVLEGIEAKHTKFLLVMATGTGKTRTAAGLIDVLIRAKWAKRILFLVDRVALQEQALNAFEEHLPSQPRWPQEKVEPFVRTRRIYVTTYPTMLNLIQRGDSPGTWISPHFFDLVIADESHRSIYNTYKQVIDYFNAITLGLTATPTDHIEHDTFKLFDCDRHHPTFAYTYEEAINHDPPYLSDFEVLNVRTKFQIEGIEGEKLPPEVQNQLIEEGIDPEDISFEGTDLERKVTNSGTNELIVRQFMEECIKDPSGIVPGKSIIFATTMAHARRLHAIFDKLYPEYQGNLARVIVSDDSRVYGKGGILDQFVNQDMPRIGISVGMLDTGVDIREVVNLVFAKPVYSVVRFWQMIGRGTRLLDPQKIKPWCPKKDKFLIIDCWANFELFQLKPRGREPGAEEALPITLFKKRIEKLEAAINNSKPEIVEAVKHDLRQDIESLPENNVVISENRAHLAVVIDEQFWTQLKPQDIKFLRSTIAPVFRARSNADFKAMRFATDIVEIQTALITKNDDAFDVIKDSICEKVSELPLTVNVVSAKKDIIDQILEPQWWKDVSDESLSSLIADIAPLMRYRQRRTDAMMELDIEDLLSVKNWIEFGPEHERMNVSAYREQVESHIRSLLDENEVLRKIRNGDSVNEVEIRALANLLQSESPYVTEELLRKVYQHKTAKFIQFIRHILGLEKLASWPETVTSAFDAFIVEHNTFSALQIQFLQTLKTFVLQTGRVEKSALIEAPFTSLHPEGIRGVFEPREIDEILAFTEDLAA